MPRTRVKVDLFQLQTVIDEVEDARIRETGKPFKTRNELCQAVVDSEWGRTVPGLNATVVYLRIRDYGLECKTEGRVYKTVEGEYVPARRVKKAFSKFDIAAFLTPFEDQGIEIEGIHSIIASTRHTPQMNAKIRGAWNLLRNQFGAPPLPREEKPPAPAGHVHTASCFEDFGPTGGGNRLVCDLPGVVAGCVETCPADTN